MKGQEPIFKVIYILLIHIQPSNVYSTCELRRCLRPYPPPRLPTISTRTRSHSNPRLLRFLLCMAWRSLGGGNNCELCRGSSGYIQLRAWNSVQVSTSAHNILELAEGAPRNKWWCHGLRTRGRLLGVVDHCSRLYGIDPVLQADLGQKLASTRFGLGNQIAEPIRICYGVMGCSWQRT